MVSKFLIKPFQVFQQLSAIIIHSAVWQEMLILYTFIIRFRESVCIFLSDGCCSLQNLLNILSLPCRLRDDQTGRHSFENNTSRCWPPFWFYISLGAFHMKTFWLCVCVCPDHKASSDEALINMDVCVYTVAPSLIEPAW